MHVCKYAMYVYHCISHNHYANYDPINIHPNKFPSAVRSPLRFPFYRKSHEIHIFFGVYSHVNSHSFPSGWWLTYPSEKYDFVSWDYYSIGK